MKLTPEQEERILDALKDVRRSLVSVDRVARNIDVKLAWAINNELLAIQKNIGAAEKAVKQYSDPTFP